MPKMLGVELTTSKSSNPQVVLIEREEALIVMGEDAWRPSETHLLLRD